MPVKSISWENVAAKTWSILAAAADQKATLSYKELGDGIGLHHRSVRYVLALLWHFRLGYIRKEHVTVRTLSGWRSCEEVEDRLPDGRHAWLWWRS